MSFEDVYPTPHRFTFACEDLNIHVNVTDRESFELTAWLSPLVDKGSSKHSFYHDCTGSIRSFLVNAPDCIADTINSEVIKIVMGASSSRPRISITPGLISSIKASVLHEFHENTNLKNKFIYNERLDIDIPVNSDYSVTGSVLFSGLELFAKMSLNELDKSGVVQKVEKSLFMTASISLSDLYAPDNEDDADTSYLNAKMLMDGRVHEAAVSNWSCDNSLEVAVNMLREGIEKIEEYFDDDLDPADVEAWNPHFGATKAFSKLESVILEADLSDSTEGFTCFHYVDYFPHDHTADLLERHTEATKIQTDRIANNTKEAIRTLTNETKIRCKKLRDALNNYDDTPNNSDAITLEGVIAKNGAIVEEAKAKKLAIEKEFHDNLCEIRNKHNKYLENLGLNKKVGSGGGIEKKKNKD